MKPSVKKSAFLLVLLFVGSLVFTACRATHSSCPAYGGEAKRYTIDRGY
ncbi:MAG: hypothetical protein WCO63_11700 [Bacteroidota bacterium]